MNKYYPLLLGAALVLTACENATQTPPPIVRSASKPAVIQYNSLGFGDGQGHIVSLGGEPLSLEAISRSASAQENLTIGIARTMTQTRGWQAEQDAARSFVSEALSKNGAVAEASVRQLAATLALLNGELLEGTLTPEKQTAVAEHVSVLVETGSPEAAIMERALRALAGFWSAEQIRHAAGVAADATTEALRIREANRCEPCEANMQSAMPDVYAGLVNYRQHQKEAAQRLSALARS